MSLFCNIHRVRIKGATLFSTISLAFRGCTDSLSEQCDVSYAQQLVNSLQVLQVVAPAMHSSLHSQVFFK